MSQHSNIENTSAHYECSDKILKLSLTLLEAIISIQTEVALSVHARRAAAAAIRDDHRSLRHDGELGAKTCPEPRSAPLFLPALPIRTLGTGTVLEAFHLTQIPMSSYPEVLLQPRKVP